MSLRKFISILALVLSSAQLFSQEKTSTYYQDPASVPPDLIVSLKHVKANLRFRPSENLVIGNVELSVVANRYRTDSITLLPLHCRYCGQELYAHRQPHLIGQLHHSQLKRNQRGDRLPGLHNHGPWDKRQWHSLGLG